MRLAIGKGVARYYNNLIRTSMTFIISHIKRVVIVKFVCVGFIFMYGWGNNSLVDKGNGLSQSVIIRSRSIITYLHMGL